MAEMIDIKSISSGLHLGEDGIWYDSDTQDISYPSEGNEFCFAVEESSFWFRHRNSCIACVVEAYPPEDHGTIFDVGGGNGFVSLGLAKAGFDVAIVEPGRIGAANAKRSGLKNVICATIHSARFNPHSLPAVGLFDVIEHMEDDLSFLKSMRDLVKKGGFLYLTVPTYSFLWSQEDVLAGHFKRYTKRTISEVLKFAGFELRFASYIFRVLPIPIFLFRVLPYRIGLTRNKKTIANVARDHAVNGGLFASVLGTVLSSEIENLRNKKAMHFGGSCLVVARNP